MKTPNKMSRKGWKLLSNSNIVSVCSSVVIVIALIITIFWLLLLNNAFNLMDYISVEAFAISIICVIVLDVLALLFVLIGRLLQWKGLTLLLGALQLPDSIIQDTTPEYTIAQEKQDL